MSWVLCVCTLISLVNVSAKSVDDIILKEKLIMASFNHPQLYTCINRTEAEMPTDTKTVMRSQCHEDKWLWDKIFSKIPKAEMMGGTFLEIGAYDGLLASNTYFFEKMFDWRGVLVEGHPLTSKLLFANKNQRSNCAVFTNGICNYNSFDNPGSLNFSISGSLTGTVVSLANKDFLNKWHKDEKGSFEVSCIPMQSILESTGMVDIDLFSLDVEGAEMYILDTINFHVTNVHVILVEADGGNPQKDQAVREFLKAYGFINALETVGSTKLGEDKWCDANIHNDVFINPHYKARKEHRAVNLMRNVNRYYAQGSALKCEK